MLQGKKFFFVFVGRFTAQLSCCYFVLAEVSSHARKILSGKENFYYLWEMRLLLCWSIKPIDIHGFMCERFQPDEPATRSEQGLLGVSDFGKGELQIW